jgi:diguanylate cyclase (GGDEF)-like protein
MNEIVEKHGLTMRQVPDNPAWQRQQLVHLLFKHCTLTLAGTMFCAVALLFLLWPHVEKTRLLLWLGAMGILTLARLIMQQRYQAIAPNRVEPRKWMRLFASGVLLSGLLWGAVSIWLFPSESMTHQVFIAVVLSGICAGAVTVYAPLPNGFLLFAGPALLPFFGRLMLDGTSEGQLTAGMVALFVVLMNRIARETGRSLNNMLELQVRNAELTRALHHQATHDSLVDLINHGEFLRRLHRLVENPKPPHRDFSLVFIDLDLFKSINDSGGHAAGDALLKAVGRILTLHTRSRDTAARVGGDEFALLLENCPPDNALQIAEKVRAEIAALVFDHEGRSYKIGASVGVTYGQTGLHSASAVLKSADAACYAAKESGRNRVRMLPADDMFKTTGRFHLSEPAGALA